jgi:hypothetical protein
MFLRFVITQIDEDSHQPQGVFAAAYDLLESSKLNSVEEKHLREILVWFEENLHSPEDYFKAQRAVFWFKSSADESIKRIWELVNLLRLHDYHVEVYKCRGLSNIVYEDKLQVAAYPSERDGKITVQ